MNRFFLPALFCLFLGISCSHLDELNKDPEESSANSDESHNAGMNCGSCHNVNGNEASGEGRWWTISGTVYDSFGSPLPNIAVELWEKPNKQGALIKKLISDKKGNFYTNQILNFKTGCAVTLTSSSGKSVAMPSTFAGGSCNGCHGISTGKMYIQP